MELTLPQWYDLHTHIRQGAMVQPLLAAQRAMGCCGILAMPNTKPPVAKIFKKDELPYWSIQEYHEMLRAMGGDQFQDLIIPLYLTKDTTPTMIEEGAKAGLLRACKYYPPHGTTGADFGFAFENFMKNGVFAAMEELGVVLCIHGEEHGLSPLEYFAAGQNAESLFYQNRMPNLVQQFPKLKVACEHVTTKVAVDFVQQNGPQIAASITPQHLLYTIGDLLQGLKYHLYCLPLLKFEEDLQALRRAVLDPANAKFYAGTDSAPHTRKATECGCAAGCFTGGIAPQLYAEAFEAAGADFKDQTAQQAFEKFLCHIGREFYGLEQPKGTFVLKKQPQEITPLSTPEGPVTPLPLGLGRATISWTCGLTS